MTPVFAWARAALVLAGVLAVDQLSKHAVRDSIAPGQEHRFLPGVELVNTRNHGVAFGFLPGHHVAVTVVIGVALLALLLYFLRHASKPLIWLPTGMLIGGSLGNILDRLRDGSVTDFIKLPLGWPPFNLADTAITLGVLILVVVVELSHDEPEREDLDSGAPDLDSGAPDLDSGATDLDSGAPELHPAGAIDRHDAQTS